MDAVVKINLLYKTRIDTSVSPVIQLYPVPPDGELRLCPGDPRPLGPAQHHPDHQAAAVAQLVRVAVIVKQEHDAAVPGVGGRLVTSSVYT